MKILAAVIVIALAALAGPVPTAVPTGKWVVDFDDNYCLASRSFTADGQEVAFGLQPWPTDEGARAFIQTPRQLTSWDWEKAEIYIGSERLKVSPLLAEPVVKPGHVRYILSLDKDQLLKLEEAERFTVDGEHVRVQFPVTELPRVRKVLDDCVVGLLQAWGLSRETQASLATFPKADLTSAFRSRDYPVEAIQRGAIGYVDVVLSVGADGKVKDCRFARASGHKELDETTCLKLRKRSKFEPARDRNGRPVASPYFTSIRWILE